MKRQVAELRKAQGLYREFIERADDAPEYRDAVKRSLERIEDIDKTIEFLEGRSP